MIHRLPVFVSSVFRDMDRERDVLVRRVFPAANAQLAASGVSLYPVDLRWGIPSRGIEQQSEYEDRILSVCLSEIRRCAPLFIGLLGNQQGYIPKSKRVEEIATAAGYSGPTAGRSLTLLEIGFATQTINSPIRPIVLARNPESIDHPTIVAFLRELGRTGCRLNRYDARWDSNVDQYEPHDSFRAELVSFLVTSAKAHIEISGTQEDIEHNMWLASHTSVYTGRTDERERILRRIDGIRRIVEDNWGGIPGDPFDFLDRMDDHWVQLTTKRLLVTPIAVVTGPRGIGKSAFLAQLELDAQAAGVPVASVSLDEFLVEPSLSQFLLAAANRLISVGSDASVETPQTEGATLAEAIEALNRSLAATEISKPKLLLLDGIDELSEPSAQLLDWLDGLSVSASTIVLSADPDSLLGRGLLSRATIDVLALEPLTIDETRQLVEALAAQHHRTLPAPVMEALAIKAPSPLWAVTATSFLLWLGADDYRILRSTEGANFRPEDLLLHYVRREMTTDVRDLLVERLRLVGEEHYAGSAVPLILLTAPALHEDTIVKVLGPLLETQRRGLAELGLAGSPGYLLSSDPGWDALVAAEIRENLGHIIKVRGGRWHLASDLAADVILEQMAAGIDQVRQDSDAEILRFETDDEAAAFFSRIVQANAYLIADCVLSLPSDHQDREMLPLLAVRAEADCYLVEWLDDFVMGNTKLSLVESLALFELAVHESSELFWRWPRTRGREA